MIDFQSVEGYHISSLQLNPNANDFGYDRQPADQAQGDGLIFHSLCEPTLQIGYACLPHEFIIYMELLAVYY